MRYGLKVLPAGHRPKVLPAGHRLKERLMKYRFKVLPMSYRLKRIEKKPAERASCSGRKRLAFFLTTLLLLFFLTFSAPFHRSRKQPLPPMRSSIS